MGIWWQGETGSWVRTFWLEDCWARWNRSTCDPGKGLQLFELQYPHLQKGMVSPCLPESWWGLSKGINNMKDAVNGSALHTN